MTFFPVGKMFKYFSIVCICLGMFFIQVINVHAQYRIESDNWKTHIEFSYVNNSGNTETQNLSGKLEFTKERGDNRYFIKGNTIYGTDKDLEIVNKWSLNGRWERLFIKRFFGFLAISYLEDKFSGYAYRFNIGPGLGYDIVKTERHDLKGLIFTLYHYDKYFEEDKGQESYGAGKVSIDYVWKVLENLKFKESANYSFSFKNVDKYFMNSDTAFEIKINAYLSLGISYLISYQNLLPSRDIDHTDTTFLTSMIIDF